MEIVKDGLSRKPSFPFTRQTREVCPAQIDPNGVVIAHKTPVHRNDQLGNQCCSTICSFAEVDDVDPRVVEKEHGNLNPNVGEEYADHSETTLSSRIEKYKIWLYMSRPNKRSLILPE